ncbi:uncharacterized protein LOC107262049 isoform X2 [Ricinus communis]|uniref:uncharacterized protein LOC107262049 isoform X2 n=1 Tax=Ricinus communis TaxID=3988 RepID=UPI00201A2FFF|nr:uncharacterized protein LOC107262049 isoform X2 [Ricinus communis]
MLSSCCSVDLTCILAKRFLVTGAKKKVDRNETGKRKKLSFVAGFIFSGSSKELSALGGRLILSSWTISVSKVVFKFLENVLSKFHNCSRILIWTGLLFLISFTIVQILQHLTNLMGGIPQNHLFGDN